MDHKVSLTGGPGSALTIKLSGFSQRHALVNMHPCTSMGHGNELYLLDNE